MDRLSFSNPGVWAGSLLAVALLATSARADAPALLPVQGYLTNAEGAPRDGEHRLTFMLYAEETGGSALYTDDYGSVSIDDGNFVVYLGSQEGEELDLSIFRDADGLWLEVVVDGDETISPRTPLGSVGYAASAQYAKVCDDAATLSGMTANAILASAKADAEEAVTAGTTDATLEGRTTFEGGVRFAGRVVKGPEMTGASFMAQTIAGTNVCTAAGYRPCTAWEAMVIDTISDVHVFDASGWVIGSFPNVEYHMRSLASGQDSTVCPPGSVLGKYASNFVHGDVHTPGGLHCYVDTVTAPVWCCREKGG